MAAVVPVPAIMAMGMATALLVALFVALAVTTIMGIAVGAVTALVSRRRPVGRDVRLSVIQTDNITTITPVNSAPGRLAITMCLGRATHA